MTTRILHRLPASEHGKLGCYLCNRASDCVMQVSSEHYPFEPLYSIVICSDCHRSHGLATIKAWEQAQQPLQYVPEALQAAPAPDDTPVMDWAHIPGRSRNLFVMAQHNNGFSSFCEAHEHRLSKAEEQLSEYRASIDTAAIKLQHLEEAVTVGFESLSSKIEGWAVDQQATGQALQQLVPRLQALELNKRIKDRRLRGLRSGAIGLFLTGAGGLAVKFSEHVWALFNGQ